MYLVKVLDHLNQHMKKMKFQQKMFDEMYSQLNTDQKYIFNEIIESHDKISFIDGPGGSGKHFYIKL